MKTVEITRSISSHQPGDIVKLTSMEADFIISRGYGILVDDKAEPKKRKPRRNPAKSVEKKYTANGL